MRIIRYKGKVEPESGYTCVSNSSTCSEVQFGQRITRRKGARFGLCCRCIGQIQLRRKRFRLRRFPCTRRRMSMIGKIIRNGARINVVFWLWKTMPTWLTIFLRCWIRITIPWKRLTEKRRWRFCKNITSILLSAIWWCLLWMVWPYRSGWRKVSSCRIFRFWCSPPNRPRRAGPKVIGWGSILIWWNRLAKKCCLPVYRISWRPESVIKNNW